MSAVLKETPCSMTYEDVQPLIDGLARTFKRRYGGDQEDLVGELSIAFLEAYESFEPEVGTFDNHMYFRGYKHLLEQARISAKRRRLKPRVLMDLEACQAPPEFNLVDFMDELSKDAQRVIRLTLRTPVSLAEEIEVRGDKPRIVRSIIRTHLLFVGWTRERIRETFAEIKTVLGTW